MQKYLTIVVFLGIAACSPPLVDEADEAKTVFKSEYPDKRWPFKSESMTLYCETKMIGHLNRPVAWLEDANDRYALNGPASYDGTPFVLDDAPDMDGDCDGEVTEAEGQAWYAAHDIPRDLTKRALLLCDDNNR